MWKALWGSLACAILVAIGLVAHAQQQVQVFPPAIATINRSVTITSGAAFQTVQGSAAFTGEPNVPTRRSLTVMNNNINGDNCWVFVGALASATTPTSILLLPGGSYTRYMPFVPSDPINVNCTTTGDTVYVDTQ